jgi:hypothetical protein
VGKLLNSNAERVSVKTVVNTTKDLLLSWVIC